MILEVFKTAPGVESDIGEKKNGGRNKQEANSFFKEFGVKLDN